MSLRNVKDLTGMRFGRLLAIRPTDERHLQCIVWECDCDCGNTCYINSGKLNSGHTRSCGCLREDNYKTINKKYNVYDMESENFGIGYTFNKTPFFFDKEDFDKIKDICWHDEKGYIGGQTKILGKIQLHRFLMNLDRNNKLMVDHINRNPLDNRKENLRIVEGMLENGKNQTISRRNTSGVMGVCYVERCIAKKWMAQIISNKVHYHLGYYKTFEEAVYARLIAEKELWGIYSPQQQLFEQYGISPIE